MSTRQKPTTDTSTTLEWVLMKPNGANVLPRDWKLWIFGVLFPAAVVAFEQATKMCAGTIFDPMPTLWHTALVASVPAINALSVRALVAQKPIDSRWLHGLCGFAIAISAFYALLFLPLLPVAVIGVLFYGLGLLPMAPLASFVVAWKLRTRLAAKTNTRRFTRPVALGALAGLTLLVALDIPQAATRLGLQWAARSDVGRREQGLALIRTMGDRDLLLHLAYDGRKTPSGLLSLLVTFGGGALDGAPTPWPQSSEVREIYYRAYGEPFNVLTPPAPNTGAWTRFGDVTFDPDHGGTTVGGRIKGLDLVSSRIDGQISATDAVAYLEWVIEFRNTSPIAREARLSLDLPPGAVVSRATLWIDGEEREAAYGSRNAVRKAYNEVAVQQRRDPLLVTTKGADRVLAQAFPVPVNGTLKFKLGISAPLDLSNGDNAVLTLPAIADRNVSIPNANAHAHALWIEASGPLTASLPGLDTTILPDGRARVSGAVSDRDLAILRPEISIRRESEAKTRVATHAGTTVQQTLADRPATAPGPLLILVDGSRAMKTELASFRRALAALPEGRRVGLMIAAEPLTVVPIRALDPRHRAALDTAIAATDAQDGEDNTPAFLAALRRLETEPDSEILWVHGPQPVKFRATSSLFEQLAERLAHYPRITLYPVKPGPNELLPDEPWAWNARTFPAHGDTAKDLTRYFSDPPADARQQIAERDERSSAALSSDGSAHIVRLWAKDKIAALMNEGGDNNRADAVALATRHQLVTPVSGAVVLETREQFERHDLKPVSKATVPTVPEPHEWLLIALLALVVTRWTWQRRQLFADGVSV